MLARSAVVVVLVAGMMVPGPPASAHEESCSGVAPVLRTCSAGQHVRNGQFIQHGIVLDETIPYTGTIVSFIVSPSGNVKRTCDVFLGEVDWCRTDVFSVWPEVGESFDHICFSYRYRTESVGGVGPWGCFIKHD